LVLLLCPPLALGCSVAGVIRDERKFYAAVMLVISGAMTVVILWIAGFFRGLFC